mgnify:CR=1 FL=1
MSLTIKPASDCKFDQLSLGEIMLRLDPGEGRVRTTRFFQAWEGGGEYNVARGLAKTFGLFYLMGFFILIVIHTYRPSRKSAAERAAASILTAEDRPCP